MKRHDWFQYIRARYVELSTVSDTPTATPGQRSIDTDGETIVSADSIDTQRAMQLLGEIHKARRDLADAQVQHKQAHAHVEEAERRMTMAQQRVAQVHAQFDELTNPEPKADQAEAVPTAEVAHSAESRRGRKRGSEDMTSTN